MSHPIRTRNLALKLAAMWGRTFAPYSSTWPTLTTYRIYRGSSKPSLIEIQDNLVLNQGEVIRFKQSFGFKQVHSHYSFTREKHGIPLFRSQLFKEGAEIRRGCENRKSLAVLYCLSQDEDFRFLPQLEWVAGHFTFHERMEVWQEYRECLGD